MGMRHEVRVMILVVLCGAGAAFPPAPPAGAEPAEHPLRAGAWALQFQVDLTGFGGEAGLSAKRHFTDRSALGLAFAFSASSSERGSERMDTIGVPGQDFDTSDSDGRDFQVAALYFFYPRPRPGANVFLAAGPFAGWSHADESTASLSIEESETFVFRSRGEADSWRAGAAAEFGFEWFFTRRLSLFTSHGVSVSYSTRESMASEVRESTDPRFNSTSTRRSEDSSVGVSTTVADLGLSVYF